MAISNLPDPGDATGCFVCGRRLADHSWWERRRCERQPFPIMFESTRVQRSATRRRWWRR
jgi:hypothetical protein